MYLLEALIKVKNPEGVKRLLRQFQNFGTRLIANTRNLNVVDYSWFEATAFRPFEYLFAVEEMNAVTAEVLIQDYVYLLRDLVDYHRYDTFRMLMTHLFELHPLTNVGKSSIRKILNDDELPEDYFDSDSIWWSNVHRYHQICQAMEEIYDQLTPQRRAEILPQIEFVLIDSYKKA